MGGANASASGSRKPSAGSRRSAARNAPSFAAVSASAGPSPSQPPPTILLGCRSFWRPRLESPGQLPTDRLAHRRVRSLGSSSSRSERPGDADDHRARRRNRLRRLGGRSRSRIRPRLDRFPLGRMREKAMRSRAKEPPNCSTTGRSRSNSPTETATKPSSKQNETLLQQPARRSPNVKFPLAFINQTIAWEVIAEDYTHLTFPVVIEELESMQTITYTRGQNDWRRAARSRLAASGILVSRWASSSPTHAAFPSEERSSTTMLLPPTEGRIARPLMEFNSHNCGGCPPLSHGPVAKVQ